MENIPANASDVKLRKIKQRLADSLMGGALARYRLDHPGFPGEELRELEGKPEADITRPQYRALCVDCDWRSKSSVSPHDPEVARTRALRHANLEGHSTRSVFDILGQLDQTFSPTSKAPQHEDV